MIKKKKTLKLLSLNINYSKKKKSKLKKRLQYMSLGQCNEFFFFSRRLGFKK